MEDLCAVVVWYNPQNLGEGVAVKNVLAYAKKVGAVFIVDNSSHDNSALAKQIMGAVYIPLMKNEGIARALNIGCDKAKKSGFKWCMTMDQDSLWDEKQISSYIEKVFLKIKEDKSIKSFAPSIKNKIEHSVLGEIKSNLGKIKWAILKKFGKTRPPLPKEEFLERAMCSGNIIELFTWKALGGFLEELFIDEVDHEFCYRLIDFGCKILRFNTVFLHHTLGEAKKTFFPKVTNHTGIRLYYIFRNLMYVAYLHPRFAKKYDYKGQIKKRLAFNVLLTPPPRMYSGIKNFFKAKHDFLLMKKARENAAQEKT